MIPRTKIMCKRDWVRLPDQVRRAVNAGLSDAKINRNSVIKIAIQAANDARKPPGRKSPANQELSNEISSPPPGVDPAESALLPG